MRNKEEGKRKTFLEWVKEHVRPSADLYNKPEEIVESNDRSDFSVKNLLNRLVVYVGFKFKF